ncbi:L,D-transpeptidase [Mesorhizobium sp. M0152]|uniref:L,D-transpeptidase n=1 Tax=unclassified Mesorhizobium TaxID=325217 RepID=UPI00333A429B
MAKRTMDRRSFLLCCSVALLNGCASSSTEDVISIPVPAERFATEPYPVWPVDRSKFRRQFRPEKLSMVVHEQIGTIIVDTKAKQLFYVTGPNTVLRYGVAVGRSGYSWKGKAQVGRKAKWPAWYPTDDMHAQTPDLPKRIAPGPVNPLGSRALYLFAGGRDTLYRIHGTDEPWTIGTEASSGCIRMINEDIIELFDKVEVGTAVIVI